jgi:hypothetical protein
MNERAFEDVFISSTITAHALCNGVGHQPTYTLPYHADEFQSTQ